MENVLIFFLSNVYFTAEARSRMWNEGKNIQPYTACRKWLPRSLANTRAVARVFGIDEAKSTCRKHEPLNPVQLGIIFPTKCIFFWVKIYFSILQSTLFYDTFVSLIASGEVLKANIALTVIWQVFKIRTPCPLTLLSKQTVTLRYEGNISIDISDTHTFLHLLSST